MRSVRFWRQNSLMNDLAWSCTILPRLFFGIAFVCELLKGGIQKTFSFWCSDDRRSPSSANALITSLFVSWSFVNWVFLMMCARVVLVGLLRGLIKLRFGECGSTSNSTQPQGTSS